jgi:hypothetical protein
MHLFGSGVLFAACFACWDGFRFHWHSIAGAGWLLLFNLPAVFVAALIRRRNELGGLYR